MQIHDPSLQLLPSYFAFIEEMRAAGEKIWDGILPLKAEADAEFVARLIRVRTQPDPLLVAESTYWGVFNGEVVGRINLRHALTQALQEFGGHIGYEVRPSARKKGVATAMLKQVLETPKAREIGCLLLTCAPFNTASIRTIEKNGGVLTKTAFVAKWNRDTNYYWIKV